MGQLAVIVLQLNPSSCKAWKVKPIARCPVGISQGLFHQSIHSSLAFVLTVGEDEEMSAHLCHRLDVVGIHPAGQGILHQLHADAIEVLNDEQVVDA